MASFTIVKIIGLIVVLLIGYDAYTLVNTPDLKLAIPPNPDGSYSFNLGILFHFFRFKLVLMGVVGMASFFIAEEMAKKNESPINQLVDGLVGSLLTLAVPGYAICLVCGLIGYSK